MLCATNDTAIYIYGSESNEIWSSYYTTRCEGVSAAELTIGLASKLGVASKTEHCFRETKFLTQGAFRDVLPRPKARL